MDLQIVGSNLKLLREEARLSIKELAEKTNLEVERIEELEKGLDKPYLSELDVLLPILRISEEDLYERDLVSERKEAYSSMKKSKERVDYNWYYGDKKNASFYIVAIIVIVGLFALCMVGLNGYLKLLNEYVKTITDPAEIEAINGSMIYIRVAACAPSGIATVVFLLIELFRKNKIQFHWWYILIITSAGGILIALGIIAAIPFVGYCVYRGIIRRGKNR